MYKALLLALCLSLTPMLSSLSGPALAQDSLDTPSLGDSPASGWQKLSAADGTLLQLRYWRVAEPKAKVLIVHGLKDHAARYEAFARHLNSNGYSVFAIDLRGHGRSGGERQSISSFSEYLGDVDSAITAIKALEPNQPTLLFGHSMGGAVATLYALDHQNQLKGLMLSAPALKEGKDVSPFLIGVTRALSGIAPGLPVLHLEHTSFSRDPAVLAELAEDSLIEQADGPARTASELLGAIETIQRREHELKLPLLVLHGEADGLTNPEGSLQLFREAASTRKTLRIYPHLYHILLDEPEKAEVYKDIDSWLTSLE